MKEYIYWRQGKQILRAEVIRFKNGWCKKAWTTELIKEFKNEETAELALRKIYSIYKIIRNNKAEEPP